MYFENTTISIAKIHATKIINRNLIKSWNKNLILSNDSYNRAFHGFGQICINLLMVWWFCFRLDPIYTISSAGSKNDTQYKSGQN